MGAATFMRNPPPGYRPAGWEPSAAQQQQRSARTYTLQEAIGSWQWYGLWALLFLNTTAGIAIISQAAPMAAGDHRRDAPPPRRGWSAPSPSPTARAASCGRWLSDVIGRRAGVPADVSASRPSSSRCCRRSRASPLFTVLACIVLLCYGGGFGTMPAFAADRFGAENVGSIYGLMLTAWGFAGVLGPMLIAGLRESTGQYDEALYVIAGLMCVSTVIPDLASARRRDAPATTRSSRQRSRSMAVFGIGTAEAAPLSRDGANRVGEPRSAAVRLAHPEGRRLRRLRAGHLRAVRLDARRHRTCAWSAWS